VNRLQQLIQDRRATRSWSYGEVARRGNLPRSTVYNLAMRETLHRPPQRATLAALARGLDLPLDVVNEAAMAATGLSVSDDVLVLPDVPALVADLERLSPADRQHVAALVESLLHRSADSPGGSSDASPTGSSVKHSA
jgi:transcriptional regulator with XRE-family HTH domain